MDEPVDDDGTEQHAEPEHDDPQPGGEVVEEPAVTPAEAERRGTEIVPMVTNEVAQLIKATINPDLTDAELILFAAVANRVGLDPLAKQIYAVKRNDNHAPGGKRMTIQTGIDGFRLIARRTGQYGGRLGPYFCGVDGDWRIQKMPDGSWAPAPWLDPDPPHAAMVGVYRRGDDVPTYGVAKWSEYAITGNGGAMWTKMPTTMIGKCAEAQAIRACFPAETSGLYTDEEMMQADAIEATATVLAAGGDAYTMQPREVREALMSRGMKADGKVEEMRDRLAQAIAQEKAAGEAARPAPAAAVEPAQEPHDEPAAPETGEHRPEEPAAPEEPPQAVSQGFDDAELIQRVVNEVKPMQLSAVMLALRDRGLDEGGNPDAKRKRLAYAVYLERGGTPARTPTVPPAEHEQERGDTALPLDEPEA